MAIKKSMTGESKGQVKRKLIQQKLDPDEYEVIEIPDDIWTKPTSEENITIDTEKLRNMLKDPRYWRDHSKEVVERIENGFKRLYGDYMEVNDEKKD